MGETLIKNQQKPLLPLCMLDTSNYSNSCRHQIVCNYFFQNNLPGDTLEFQSSLDPGRYLVTPGPEVISFFHAQLNLE